MSRDMDRFVEVSLPEQRLMEQGRRLAAIRQLLGSETEPRYRVTADVDQEAKDAAIHDLYLRAVARRHQAMPDSLDHQARLVRARHHLRDRRVQ